VQHPFVSSKSVDKKPILDLLAEFKAEIINEVEEEIEDEVRIQDPDPENRDIMRSVDSKEMGKKNYFGNLML
jgi:hypothetical protein